MLGTTRSLEPVKSGVKALFLHAGLYHFRRWIGRLRHPGPRLIVLVYHNLADDSGAATGQAHHFDIRPELPASIFAAHMKVLREEFPVVSLQEGVRRLKDGSLLHDSVAITFDDAYKTFDTLAFPELQKLGLPATVFVPTDYIQTNRIFWWDELNQICFWLSGTEIEVGDLEPSLGADWARRLVGARGSMPRMEGVLFSLEADLRYEEDARRNETVQALRELLPVTLRDRIVPEPMMTWSDMRRLAGQGIDFQSHTCSHFAFAHVNAAQVEHELVASRDKISGELDRPVTLLAYPYGGDRASYARFRELFPKCGYEAARTTSLGYNDARFDPYLMNAAGIGTSGSRSVVRRDLILGFVREAT